VVVAQAHFAVSPGVGAGHEHGQGLGGQVGNILAFGEENSANLEARRALTGEKRAQQQRRKRAAKHTNGAEEGEYQRNGGRRIPTEWIKWKVRSRTRIRLSTVGLEFLDFFYIKLCLNYTYSTISVS